jgi:hypothetical protein
MALVSAGSAPARKPLLLHSLAEERGGINGSSHIYLGLVQRDILSVVCAWRNRKRVVYGVVFLLLLLIEDLFGCTCIHFNLYVLGGLEYKFHPNSLRHLWIDVDTYVAKQNIMRYVGPVFFAVFGWESSGLGSSHRENILSRFGFAPPLQIEEIGQTRFLPRDDGARTSGNDGNVVP